MADLIAFTRNDEDISNESGYQFEFKCDRGNNGVRSTFKRSVSGTASSASAAASNIFGGNCGHKNAPTTKFCGECGAKLR